MDARESEYSDVIIVGAGFSGIGAAYRIREKNPDLTITILERRERLGGTWDLFRYPGIRSDSDIFTLSFPWEPWNRPEAIADGPDIWQYMADTACKHGIDQLITYRTAVRSADWNSATDIWTVRADRDGTETVLTARFLFFASGYYDYDQPHVPDFPGIGDFRGEVIHPQHWPDDFDPVGQRLVVIGSGATAVSMIPSLARTAARVTMLQRTPSYLLSVPRVLPPINVIRRVLPGRAGHLAARWLMSMFGSLVWLISRRAPALSKRLLRRRTMRELPADYPVDVHFRPPYDPWDQRMCFMVDSDLLKGIAAGDVEVVTDHVDHFDSGGIVLRSGRRLEADAVITATGLRMQALGGVALSVDGDAVEPHQRFMYRRRLLEDVPNVAWCMGYTNASWTLGADMTARAVADLLAYMGSHGYTHAYPHRGQEEMAEQPAFNLQSGYVLRGLEALPKSATQRPWMLSHTYIRDAVGHRLEQIDESMVFGRAGVREPHPA